jgi:DNA-binding response OmpR family regulator
MDRVLIVDDEKSIRVTLCEFLRNQGYEADAAEDAGHGPRPCSA